MQEARFAGVCQDQHAGRPAPSSKGNQSVQQAEASAVSQKSLCRCNKPRLRGLGPGLPGAWGPGLGAGASGGLGGLQGLGAQATRAAWACTSN